MLTHSSYDNPFACLRLPTKGSIPLIDVIFICSLVMFSLAIVWQRVRSFYRRKTSTPGMCCTFLIRKPLDSVIWSRTYEFTVSIVASKCFRYFVIYKQTNDCYHGARAIFIVPTTSGVCECLCWKRKKTFFRIGDSCAGHLRPLWQITITECCRLFHYSRFPSHGENGSATEANKKIVKKMCIATSICVNWSARRCDTVAYQVPRIA